MEEKFYVLLKGVEVDKEADLKLFILRNFKYEISSHCGWIVDIVCKEPGGFLLAEWMSSEEADKMLKKITEAGGIAEKKQHNEEGEY